MVNHVRTLLLNLPGAARPRSSVGEEYVPPAFRARRLPGFLNTALPTVFGANPDRLYRNYRVRQLMQLLHATELDAHVRSFDPRITYDLHSTDLFDGVFGCFVVPRAGTTAKIHVAGNHSADDAGGRSQLQWAIALTSPTTARIQRQTPPVVTTSRDLVVTNALSDAVPLPGAGLTVRFAAPQAGDGWTVTSRARPADDLATRLVHLASVLGAAGVDQLLAGDGEPYVTYRNLWRHNDVFAYKYGALLLAIARAIDRSPQAEE